MALAPQKEPGHLIQEVCRAWETLSPFKQPLNYEAEIENFSQFLVREFLPTLVDYDTLEVLALAYISAEPDSVAEQQTLQALQALNQASMDFEGFIGLVGRSQKLSPYIAIVYQKYYSDKFNLQAPMSKFFVLTYLFPIFTKVIRAFIGEIYLKKELLPLLHGMISEEYRLIVSLEILKEIVAIFSYNSAVSKHGICSAYTSDYDFKILVASLERMKATFAGYDIDADSSDFQKNLKISCEQVIAQLQKEFFKEFLGIKIEGYVHTEDEIYQMIHYRFDRFFLPPHTHLPRNRSYLFSLLFEGAEVKRYREAPEEAAFLRDCQCHVATMFSGNMSYVVGELAIINDVCNQVCAMNGVRVKLALGQLLGVLASKLDTVGAIKMLSPGSDSGYSGASSPGLSPGIVGGRAGAVVPPVASEKASGAFSSIAYDDEDKGQKVEKSKEFFYIGRREVNCQSEWVFHLKPMMRVHDAMRCVDLLTHADLLKLKKESWFYAIFGIAFRNLKEMLVRDGRVEGFLSVETNHLTKEDLKAIYDDPDALFHFMNILMAMMHQALIPENDIDRIQGDLKRASNFHEFNKVVFDFLETFWIVLETKKTALNAAAFQCFDKSGGSAEYYDGGDSAAGSSVAGDPPLLRLSIKGFGGGCA